MDDGKRTPLSLVHFYGPPQERGARSWSGLGEEADRIWSARRLGPAKDRAPLSDLLALNRWIAPGQSRCRIDPLRSAGFAYDDGSAVLRVTC